MKTAWSWVTKEKGFDKRNRRLLFSRVFGVRNGAICRLVKSCIPKLLRVYLLFTFSVQIVCQLTVTNVKYVANFHFSAFVNGLVTISAACIIEGPWTNLYHLRLNCSSSRDRLTLWFLSVCLKSKGRWLSILKNTDSSSVIYLQQKLLWSIAEVRNWAVYTCIYIYIFFFPFERYNFARSRTWAVYTFLLLKLELFNFSCLNGMIFVSLELEPHTVHIFTSETWAV